MVMMVDDHGGLGDSQQIVCKSNGNGEHLFSIEFNLLLAIEHTHHVHVLEVQQSFVSF